MNSTKIGAKMSNDAVVMGRSSVVISKTSKGIRNWEVKVYADTAEEAMTEAVEIDRTLAATDFPETDD